MQDVKPLTERQKQVLDFINSFLSEKGISPSLKEIASFLNTNNLSSAQYFINELEDKGYLRKNANKARGIMPIPKKYSIPLLGFIAAGEPIEPIESPDEISIPPSMEIDIKYPHYALQVKGDSMIDMGILDGDIVIIKHQLTASSGETVVAVTENGATLKIFKKENDQVFLEPRNKEYQTIYPQRLDIRGKFVGLIRN
ncbi:transcriptional repressor LexA [Candidatus Microgenomates bacterium]|jgi:SOS regulatory protein LexA|nr:MAG: transcriptional repressor LexA [Candidatus Microgenomates bacterium]